MPIRLLLHRVLVAEVRLDRSLHDPHRPDPLSQLTLRAGKGRKPFAIHRHLLATKVPYFTDLFSREPTPGLNKLTFDELDEYGFAIFVRWLYGGELNGPKDFHSLTHYLALYCLALRFGVEDLQNECECSRRDFTNGTTDGNSNRSRSPILPSAQHDCTCLSPGIHLQLHRDAEPHEELSHRYSGLSLSLRASTESWRLSQRFTQECHC